MGDTVDRLTLPRKRDRISNYKELQDKLIVDGSPSNLKQQPLEGVPPNPLPTWVSLPLEAKLPMLPGPKGSATLFTTNLGEKIHKRDPELGFDLTDPNFNFMSNEYKPLHDPHLKTHLNVPQMRKRLRRGGFITTDGKVVCSLKEYNDYRQYLRQINLMLEKKEKSTDCASPPHAKVKKVVNEGNAARHQKVKQTQERLAQQHEQERQRYASILAADDDRVVRMRQEQMANMCGRMIAAKAREQNRIKRMHQKQYDESLRRMAIIQSWIDDDKARQTHAESRRRQREQERQKMLEESWDMRRSIQESKIEENMRRQAHIDEEKRRRIEEREHVLTRQLHRQQERFLRLTQTRRTARGLLEEEYLKKFAAKISFRRAASARLRQRRADAMRRRYERLRPRSNWDIERSILMAIDNWGQSYSDGELEMGEEHRQESFLRVFQDKSSNKSIADLSLGDYKGASFNQEVVQIKSPDGSQPTSPTSVELLEGSRPGGPRTTAQELYDILKSQRLKEEDDSHLEDVEKAAKAIVDMTVFLTTQVIYPAYLTYLQEDHPEVYTQYFDRPPSPIPFDHAITVGGEER